MRNDDRDVTTVFLDHKRAGRSIRAFYCAKCGKCVCEVFGDVTLLVPGQASPVDLPGVSVAVNCNGYLRLKNGTNVKCDAKYVF